MKEKTKLSGEEKAKTENVNRDEGTPEDVNNEGVAPQEDVKTQQLDFEGNTTPNDTNVNNENVVSEKENSAEEEEINPEFLAKEVKNCFKHIEECNTKALDYTFKANKCCYEMGEIFNKAKKHLTKHGEFSLWLENEVNKPKHIISQRTVEMYMKVVNEFPNPQPVANLTITKLYALARIPKEKRDAFIDEDRGVDDDGEKITIINMSKREVEVAVKKYMAKNYPGQQKVPEPPNTSKPKSEDHKEKTIKKMEKKIESILTSLDKESQEYEKITNRLKELCEKIQKFLQIEESFLKENGDMLEAS